MRVLGVSLLALAAGMVAARAETRSLNLVNQHTQEHIDITFKRDGQFVPGALTELNHFLRDWRRNEEIRMDPRLFDLIWEMYQQTGSTDPIQVICGYRSLATNDMLRTRSRMVAKHSQHTLGKAMDFRIPGVSPETIREIAVKMQEGGVGFYPASAGNFNHLDVGSVRSWPRLPRTTLVRLFPDGKTVHMPADGKPLAGYEEARAELAAKGIATAGHPLSAGEDDDGNGGSIAVAGNASVPAPQDQEPGFLARLFGIGKSKPAVPDPQAQEPVVAAAASVREPTPEIPGNDRSAGTTSVAVNPKPGAVLSGMQRDRVEQAFNAPSVMPRVKPADAPASAVPGLVWQTGAQPIPGAAADVALNAPRPMARPKLDNRDIDEGDAGSQADNDPPSILPRSKPQELLAMANIPAAPPALRPSLEDKPAAAPRPVVAPSLALGYAALPRERNIEDLIPRLPPHRYQAGKSAATARLTPSESAPVPALGTSNTKADPMAELSRGSLPTNLPVLDASTTTRRADFAVLSRPDAAAMPSLLATPSAVVAASFAGPAIHNVPSSQFTGAAINQSAIIDLTSHPRQTAQN